MFILGDFFLYLLYVLSFSTGILILCSKRNARPHIWLRYALCFVGAVVIAVILSWLMGRDRRLPETMVYGILTVCAIVWSMICFHNTPLRWFYNSCSALLLCQTYSIFSSMIVFMLGKTDQYERANIIPMVLIRFFVLVLVYCSLYFLFLRKIQEDVEFELRPLPTALMFVMTGMIFSYLGDTARVLKLRQGEWEYIRLCLIWAIFCITMLAFFYYIWDDSRKLAAERSAVQAKQGRIEQLQVFNELITDVNIRIHDLKHQVMALSEEGGPSPEAVAHLADTISGYDSFVWTGNDMLDMLLTEKNMRCRANRIQAVFSVDGEQLAGFTTEELASLFGNAIDNAIEYLLNIPEKLRFLTVSCAASNEMVRLTFRNYCDETILFDKSGLPQTTKGRASEHGFGTKSIRRVVEQHKGVVSFRCADGVFTVGIIFPSNSQHPREPVV